MNKRFTDFNGDPDTDSSYGERSYSDNSCPAETDETIIETRTNKKKDSSIFLVVLFFFSAALILSGIKNVNSSVYAKMHYTGNVKGMIIRIECDPANDADDNDVFYPIVEYTVDNESYTVKGHDKAYFKNYYKLGQKMTVAYDPGYPAESIVKDDIGGHLSKGLIYIILGVLMSVWGIYQIVAKCRKK